MFPVKFGILTISDSCSENKNDDRSGPLLERLVTDKESEIGRKLNAEIECSAIIPDDELFIQETLIRWSDDVGVNVILTTGGTGFSSRDVTPEATKKVIIKEAPGITHAMFTESLKVTPMASLSRAVSGIRGKTLIINFPGSPKAVKECFNAVANVIPHAVDLILDVKKSVKEAHHDIQHSEVYHSCPHKKSAASLSLDNVAGRLRESPFPMISIEESQKLMKNSVVKEMSTVKVNIWDAFGRVLAETVFSPCDLPPFRASIKDGYAVIAKDGKGKRMVLGGLEAGHKPGSVKIVSGSCVRINTGAAVPDEATAVVQVEDTKLLEKGADGKEEKVIEILTEPKDGQDIRPIGSDIKKGSIVLKAGTKIGAVELGILAACGCSQIPVTYLPKIGVLSTGNELQDAGEAPKPGHVYDSNKITLIMMLKENGYSAVDLGVATDQEKVMIDAIEKAVEEVDLIITTGSVSMGDRDMLKPILKEIFNATIHFGRVNLKPGKPTTFATCVHNGKTKYFLCLPGNPVSAMVTANLFVFPLLNHLTKNNAKPVVVKAKVTSKYVLDPRPEFARVILEWSDDDVYPKAYSTGNQISSKLLSCKNANALLMLPGKSDSQAVLEEGAVVPAMLLGFNQHVG
ncbi:molybdenum cofactor synthesis protein cinnamon isoform X1 [Nasonia vitripennis]|uniref:MoaB/Mog domain-containing protein n=1 Tax=Nasonia vitripennis TaxID=7425 RepID=A0A7M7QWC9_NASVI|nr:molybdenum cofactor synthesis protein cinnamon [Nasonia vitripennis]XP_008213941.1 molybdenum cofactor synthesis protein cinnamon isoform X1 [Nasonia vitripennis]XP_032454706.1 molybdenum cofactor synthesis protein cinnamon isoform X1 [Nasonia vitripennis]